MVIVPGVGDFTLRRGQVYGIVHMVDCEASKPVQLLAGRDAQPGRRTHR
jgi:hypothetical protein